MFKKILSLTLTLLLIITTVNIALTTSAFAETTSPNLIGDDGRFESETSLSGWTIHNNPSTSSDTFTRYKDEDGTYCVGAPAGVSMFKAVTLTANTEYTVSFDFKFTSDNVPSNYNSYYRAGFMASVGNLSSSAFTVSYYNIYTQHTSTKTDWQTHTYTYTPTADFTGYFVIGSFNGDCVSGMNVDNIIVTEATNSLFTVTATAEEGGTVTGAGTYVTGETATLTATPDEGYTFKGWFSVAGCVSTDATYSTPELTANVSYIAHFRNENDINLLKNGDFESEISTAKIFDGSDASNDQGKMASEAGKWGRLYSGVTVMNRVAEENGNHYLQSGSTTDGNNYIRGFGQFVYLEAGEYVLTFSAISNDASHVFYGVYNTGSTVGSSNAVFYSPFDISETWKKYSTTFTVTTPQYYQVGFGGNTSYAGVSFSIDDVILTESSNVPTVVTEVEGYGKVSGSGVFLKGETANLVATTIGDSDFIGWYNGEEEVSADAEYSFTVTENVTLTAKFTNPNEYNLVGDGTFESSNTFADYGWNLYQNGSTATTFTVERDSNRNSNYVTADAGLSMYKKVNLVAGTTYTVSFDVKFSGTATANGQYYRSGFMTSAGALTGSNFQTVAGTYSAGTNYYQFYDKHSTKTSWETLSYTFTPTSNVECYFVIGCYNQEPLNNVYLDNVVVTETLNYLNISATATIGGTVTGSGSYLKGTKATVTATPNEGGAFIGWYNNTDGKLVSNSATYTFTVTEGITLVAKFRTEADNVVVNGNFELDFDFTSNVQSSTTKYVWGGIASGVQTYSLVAAQENITTDEKFGEKVLKYHDVANGDSQIIREFGQYVELDENAWYEFSFWAKRTDSLNTKIYGSIVKDGTSGTNRPSTACNNNEYGWGALIEKGDGEWTEYRKVIYTGTDYTNPYVGFGVAATATGVEVYIDNVKLVKLTDETVELSTTVGTAMKISTDDKSGIRFKNNIKDELLNPNAIISGYTVVDYGTVVMKADYLGESELTVNSSYQGVTKTITAKTGQAYWADIDGNVTKEIVFARNDGNRDFTAVLVNMSSGNFGKQYAARVYAKLQNASGDEIIVYDDSTQYGSVYDVVCCAINDPVNDGEDTTVANWVVEKNLVDAVNKYATENADVLGVDATKIADKLQVAAQESSSAE